MKLSVIVPVYKVPEEYLRGCLQSLCDQREESVEFLVVDDGSPDNCGEVCEEFAAKDSRIKVFHVKNAGVSNARNVGIHAACGEYIMFLDGDDYLEKDICSNSICAMDACNSDLMLFGFSTNKYGSINTTLPADDGSLKTYGQEKVDELLQRAFSGWNSYAGFRVGSPWGKLFRRDKIMEHGTQFVVGLKKSQDIVFMVDYLLTIHSVSFYSKIGYYYIINDSSVTHRYNKAILETIDSLDEQFTRRLSSMEEPRKKILQNAYCGLRLYFLIDVLTLDILNSQNHSSLREARAAVVTQCRRPMFSEALKIKIPGYYGKRRCSILLLLKYRFYWIATLLGKKIL